MLEPGKCDVPDKMGAARQIERHPRQRLVHRNIGRAITPHATPLGKCLAQGLADGYADIFNGVMHIDVQGPLAP